MLLARWKGGPRADPELNYEYRCEVHTLGNEPLKPILTPKQYDQSVRLGNILMPYAARQRRALFEKEPNQTHARLIHYTTAESAMGIIRSKRFWMRNTNCMSDYREVQLSWLSVKWRSDVPR
jgi:hypothetical protein